MNTEQGPPRDIYEVWVTEDQQQATVVDSRTKAVMQAFGGPDAEKDARKYAARLNKRTETR